MTITEINFSRLKKRREKLILSKTNESVLDSSARTIDFLRSHA